MKILFLNKEDLFNEKIRHSSIRRYFPDYDGESKDAEAGKEYFKRRFIRIAYKGFSQWKHQQRRENERKASLDHDHKRTSVAQRPKRQIYVQ